MNNRYFEKFPIIEYRGQKLRNIILKSRIIREVFENITIFHPLTVEDGERPDTVAYDFYGDSELYWLVLYANDIVDPYYDWPMSQKEFRAYIIKKYGRIETAMQTIVHWKNPNYDYVMTPESKANLTPAQIEGWNIPVYAFDYENELNESKRNIKLIDPSYVPQIVSELTKIYE